MQIDTGRLKAEYDVKTADFNMLIETVKFVLQKEINRHKIKIHSISHRVKSFDSFLDKIRRKKTSEPFKEIHDLVGLRIICLFQTDLPLLRDIIQKEFDIQEVDDKTEKTQPDIFGYMSLHCKAKLKVKSSSQVLDSMHQTPFEIQVRTIAQDAWASISHYLDYKTESSLPEQLRRDFYALSGLFYVADTHFSMLKKEQSKFYINTTMEDSNVAEFLYKLSQFKDGINGSDFFEKIKNDFAFKLWDPAAPMDGYIGQETRLIELGMIQIDGRNISISQKGKDYIKQFYP